MNVVEKAASSLRPNAVDFERFRLRRFIESLGGATNSRPAASRPISPTSRRCWRATARRCCSAAAGPEKAELVGNVMGSRSRIARGFGVTPDELLHEIQRRLRNKPEIVEVTRAEAPCQQVVLTGDDADLTKLPVHLQHGADGGPYISASIDFVIDPKTGFTNVGMRRLMLRGRTRPASTWSRRAICARSTRRAPRRASRCR